MADPDYIFMDGFDYDTNIVSGIGNRMHVPLNDFWGTATTAGYWRSAAPLAGSGKSLYWGTTSAALVGGLSHALPARHYRCIGGCHFAINSTGNNNSTAIVTLAESSNNSNDSACSVMVNHTTGNLEVRRGGYTDAVIASVAGAFPLNTSRVVSWDLCPKNTGGYAKVWLDGELVIDISATDTTRLASDGYTHMNVVPIYFSTWDHFYSWHYLSDVDGGETPALDLPIIDTALADAVVSGGSTAGIAIAGNLSGSSEIYEQFHDDYVYMTKVVATASGSFDSVCFSNGVARGSAVLKPVVYANSGTAPGALLATGPAQTGIAASVGIIRLPLDAPVAVTEGSTYWIGWHGDVEDIFVDSSSPNNDFGQGVTFRSSVTYTGTVPDPAPASISSYYSALCWMEIATTDRADAISQVCLTLDDIFGYNTFDAVSEQDRFSFPNLPVEATSVHCVGLRALTRKSESGALTFDLQMISNGTTGAGDSPGLSPQTAWFGQDSYFVKNPDGDIAWTPTTVNNSDIAIEIKTLT